MRNMMKGRTTAMICKKHASGTIKKKKQKKRKSSEQIDLVKVLLTFMFRECNFGVRYIHELPT